MRKLFGELAYRSKALEKTLAEAGVLLVIERSAQYGERQQVEVTSRASSACSGSERRWPPH